MLDGRLPGYSFSRAAFSRPIQYLSSTVRALASSTSGGSWENAAVMRLTRATTLAVGCQRNVVRGSEEGQKTATVADGRGHACHARQLITLVK